MLSFRSIRSYLAFLPFRVRQVLGPEIPVVEVELLVLVLFKLQTAVSVAYEKKLQVGVFWKQALLKPIQTGQPIKGISYYAQTIRLIF